MRMVSLPWHDSEHFNWWLLNHMNVEAHGYDPRKPRATLARPRPIRSQSHHPNHASLWRNECTPLRLLSEKPFDAGGYGGYQPPHCIDTLECLLLHDVNHNLLFTVLTGQNIDQPTYSQFVIDRLQIWTSTIGRMLHPCLRGMFPMFHTGSSNRGG